MTGPYPLLVLFLQYLFADLPGGKWGMSQCYVTVIASFSFSYPVSQFLLDLF